jgi:hypothetical protein
MTSFLDQLPTKRRCGECDLCCTTVSVTATGRANGSATVPDFYKAAACRCTYQAGDVGRSCTVYSDRPYICREYACAWRCSDTLLPESMWPARIGFVVSMSGVFGEFPPVFAVTLNPDHPTAWNKNHHRREFFRLAKLFNAIVVIGESPHAELLFTPRGNTYSREEYPVLFKAGSVGLPSFEYLPFRLSMDEIAMMLFGVVAPS